jgi:hypothetical protein
MGSGDLLGLLSKFFCPQENLERLSQSLQARPFPAMPKAEI